jgi:tricarballylate dehydrogenase
VRGYDVVIVGAGNAAFCAAHAARERVERVVVLEKASREWAGGNTYFTAGAFRTTFRGIEELRPLLDVAKLRR